MGETPANAADGTSTGEGTSAEATGPGAAGRHAAPGPDGPPAREPGRLALLLRPEAGLPLITLLLCVYLTFSSEYFLQWQNLLNVTFAVSAIGIAAAFATLVVIGGGLDLTPVTVGILAGLTCVKGLDAGIPVLVVVAMALAAAAGIGLINGLLVGVGRLNPFIVTLGTNFLFTGIAFVVTSGGSLNVENSDFAKIGQSTLWFDIPTPTVIMVLTFAAAWFLLRYTRFGTHVMAIGGDEGAARLGGVRVVRVKIILYTTSALAAGIAGVVAASAAGSVAAYAASGSNDLLAIIAAVIIGGTALTGGHGSVVGTLVGVLLIGIIGNGLVLDNISSFYQPVVTGSILLIAIILDEVRAAEHRARMSAVPALEARGLVKTYGTITAVNEVDITIGAGQVVAVVGDNGAGKSTLIKMLSGAVIPDRGELFVGGEAVKLSTPNDARAVGIETIYQDLALLPNLDVTTNLYLGREQTIASPFGGFGILARRRMREEARQHLSELRISLPKTWGTPVSSLSGGQRQSVAIARAMVWASRLVIMDEPTAALGVAQSQAVLDLVRRVRERGTSVVIISHILPHILELADRIVVMRHGSKVADLPAEGVSQDDLIELIVGFERRST